MLAWPRSVRLGVMTEPAKTKRRIDEIGDESRRRILDAAEELFAEKGFDRTSFVDIAARSGISRGSIPWHFQNKDGLLTAVIERVIDRHVTTDAEQPSEVSMLDMTAEMRELMRSSPSQLLYMLLTEAMNSEGLVNEHYRVFFRSRRKLFARWMLLRDATKTLTPAEAKSLAVIVNGALLGIQMQWQIDPDSVDLDSALALFASIVDGRLAGVATTERPVPPTQRTARKAGAV